jgi:hypothetical protein
MSIRSRLDTQRGVLPEIRAEGDSVVFQLGVVGVQKGARVVVRCDDQGNVSAAIFAADALSDDLQINRPRLQRRSSR